MARFVVIFAAALTLAAGSASAQLFPSFGRHIEEPEPAPPPAVSDALPDPSMTPGAIDKAVTLSDICNGTTKTRRPPTTKYCERAFAAYSIPPADRYQYECDHLVPIALGGASTITNLWPQPNVEAALKDRLEVEMQRRVCVAYRTLAPEEAAKVLADEQREVADNWVAAEKRYLLP